MKQNKFNIKSIEELNQLCTEFSLDIHTSNDLDVLKKEIKLGNKIANNAFAVLPMEGCDSNPDGSPSELVTNRYLDFSKGGAGLVWYEACAVIEDGKANPNQMMITKENVSKFKELLDTCNSEAIKKNGFKPITILQLTHSGRYSRPYTHTPAPIIPQHDPLLDPRVGIDETHELVTDEYLANLVPLYVQSAKLALEAGFDGVDIKACHRYLISELLASHTREGIYGGSFENRTRLLKDIICAVKKELPEDFIIACRFNVFDAHPYPYGFGCKKDDMWSFDEEEAMRLVNLLVDNGVTLLSNSAGNPYYIYPQVTRPFDTSSMGIPVPEEHQLQSIDRLFKFSETVKKAAKNALVIGNGYTWLRQFVPYVGAYNIINNRCDFIGLGRSSIAYPNFPIDTLNNELDSKKCCITCSKCTQIMRDHGMTGCVIRNSKIYAPLYKKYREESEEREANK